MRKKIVMIIMKEQRNIMEIIMQRVKKIFMIQKNKGKDQKNSKGKSKKKKNLMIIKEGIIAKKHLFQMKKRQI